ncbi:2-succinyl-5-enolpyruvyl-6-hydroxy-3-cyclohexene-1-carboxylic-acid synthase [Chromatium weissei]|nr:2-succinyl-5-enolpyruvyl-6-hydroxy-3-cyclohexene-1-carboxylic-acid synthase [Chromatium weissei]
MDEHCDQGCQNLRWALALLDGLVAGGMRHLVFSPGSRSTPMLLAAQRQPNVTLTPILDERSAAFFALGLARAAGHPVGLLCTSGSALAHWFPAVIEAYESEIPLILLSADRPPELRGWGANQTIDQTRLFGGFVREFHDPGSADSSAAALKMMRTLGARVAAVSLGNWPGPVHINLPFREPLVPTADCTAESNPPLSLNRNVGHKTTVANSEQNWGEDVDAWTRDLTAMMSGRGLICCGPGTFSPVGISLAPLSFAESLWKCAEQLGVPVLCDPLSGLRFGTNSTHRITRYDSFLRQSTTATALKPDWVLRIGRAPVSKILLNWLADIPTILVDPGQGWSDPNKDVRVRVNADASSFCNWLATLAQETVDKQRHADWSAQWAAIEQRSAQLTADYLAQAPWCEAHLITALLAHLPANDGLFCANSMPIRQLDTWSGGRTNTLGIFGNRGASGIDGQTSTLAGLNASGIPITGLLGDLSFFHDLSGLLLLRQLQRPCIVLNNGGGRIFDYLPQRGLPDFERLWHTPIDLNCDLLLRPFGIKHCAVTNGDEFQTALTECLKPNESQNSGIIEVRIDAECSRRIHYDFWQHIQESQLI